MTELDLVPPLLEWLQSHRRIGRASSLVLELPRFGRRVDVATRSRLGRYVSYELKRRDNLRAIEQAALNRRAFDQTYVVTLQNPGQRKLEIAAEAGVGIILLRSSVARVLMESPVRPVELILRTRLAQEFGRHLESRRV